MTVKPDELTPALFMRLYSVLEMRQQITPDPARAEVLKSLQSLRNDVAHSAARAEDVLRELAPKLPELVEYLHLLEGSSLGTPFAKSMRALSTPDAINNVLLLSIEREEVEHRRAQKRQETGNSASTRKTDTVRDDLVLAAVKGDHAALTEVMSRVRPLVRRYCSVRLRGHGPDAEKMLNEVTDKICVAVEKTMPSLTDGQRVLPHAYGIAAHHVSQILHSIGVSGLGEAVGDLGERMSQLVMLLPAKQREVLLLRIMVGLSAEETAQAVGSTPGAVRVAQHRALVNLRKQISRMDPMSGAENVADF